MKKRITTYILFVGFILFSLNGVCSGGPQKKFAKKNTTSFSAKARTVYSKVKPAGHHPFTTPDQLCSSLPDVHQAGCSSVSPLLANDTISLEVSFNTSRILSIPAMKAPNGYLLHLYPSHYFW